MIFITALLASSATAFKDEGDELSTSDQYCKPIAGAYQFVETVNEYNDVEVTSQGTAPPNITHCEGGVGYLIITHNCKWTWKKVRNDPDNFCEDDEGFTDNSLLRTEVEFWRIRRFQQESSVGLFLEDFIFTVEEIPGLLGGNAKRIQGIVERRNGCDMSFEGWEIDLDDVERCTRGFSLGGRIGNEVFNKREAVEEETARLTSSSDEATASDIKDALAKIAAALPDTFETDSPTSDDNGESSSETAHCAPIAGIYQFVETVNEYDDSETSLGADTSCHGGLGFLEIHDTCEWIYKKVEVGGDVPESQCFDDAGFDETGVMPLENEFYFITREEFDNNNVDFKFSIQKLAGSSHAPTRIQGILEKDNGCDIAFEGWLTQREHIHACRDRSA